METIALMETMVTLLAKNHQLQQENSRMHNSMFTLVKENFELKSLMQGKEPQLDCTVCPAEGKSTSSLWTSTCDESQFRKGLKPSAEGPKTSSPTALTPAFQNSTHKVDSAEWKNSSGYFPQDPKRILGEVALQLDRRILSYVFQGHKRRYGFTISNIPAKIKEVSIHPLTRQVNEDYELHLTRRYDRLMGNLTQKGYRTPFHPLFSEFIVNTFGVFERPGSQTLEYNNPDFLKTLIMTEAPQNLQEDLIIILDCLCFMAEKYKRTLFKWY
ncbi:speriolin-like protein [Synchiropus picturatus]